MLETTNDIEWVVTKLGELSYWVPSFFPGSLRSDLSKEAYVLIVRWASYLKENDLPLTHPTRRIYLRTFIPDGSRALPFLLNELSLQGLLQLKKLGDGHYEYSISWPREEKK